MTFVFFDTETTGLNRSFDQILQFAAIRTDDQLNEVDEFEIRCRLLPDIAPSVSAIRVNRVTVRELTDESLPSHYEMVRRIREKLVSWSPAVFVGYNSIRFDEHLLRQALFRTLHPPYLTNTNGNSRCDAMRLIQASSVFSPDAIVLPSTAASDRTFRLDRVAPANDFDHVDAHDAMADVRATIHLCRLLADRAPDLWSTTIRLSRKSAIQDFVETETIFSLTDFYYGRTYSWIVTTIGHNDENTNDIYVFNLAVAPESLTDLGESAMRRRVAQRPKPVRRIRANAVPIVSRLEHAPRAAEGITLGFEELHRRSNVLRSDARLRARLIAAFEAIRQLREPSPHIEEQLYDAFFTHEDARLMDAFHVSEWVERLPIVDRFDDTRLREFGYRLVHCERPDLLDVATRHAHDNRIARNLLGLDGGPWLSLREAIQEANDLLVTAHGDDLTHIREHRDYLQRRLAEAMRRLSDE
jgi:exodeoxyribonuclease-1